ncbi:unnamed protein product [Arctia plantaginis]|uniref:Uncharacterized protein n=1 Tax=Arctia plantaginis TaxID=874455 RepID=A0A8S1A1B1_ARCPL|nr:unnamed protein product [Arctia plantaginis]
MFVWKPFVLLVAVCCTVDAVPIVFKESTPNGEAFVSISSSDPDVEKYLSQQFSTRSGFTQVDTQDNYPNIPGTVHSSFSIAVPGKAIAGNGRSFASASSGPFLPIFAFPINPFSSNGFPEFKNWVRNYEGYYDPNFAGNGQVHAAAAVNDNGHVYGKVNTVAFDNKAKNPTVYSKNVEN